MKKTVIVLLLIIMTVCGCNKKDNDTDERCEVEFTVVAKRDIPTELMGHIDEKKTEEFQICTMMEGYTYLAVGYGTMPTGGYCIRIEDIYETDKNLVLETALVEPSDSETVNKLETYPYIVIKIKYTDKNVIFK